MARIILGPQGEPITVGDAEAREAADLEDDEEEEGDTCPTCGQRKRKVAE